MSIEQNIFDVLKGKFLTGENSIQNWGMTIYVVLLFLFIIASSHSVDKKVREIAELNKQVKELRAEYIDTRTYTMQLKLESTIRKKVESMELKPISQPPYLIKIVKEEEKN
jgi:hypothetical protein